MGSRVERESKKRRRLPLRSVSDPGHDGKSHWYRWLSLGVSIRFGVLVLAKELRLQRDEGEKEVEFADSSHRRWKVRCLKSSVVEIGRSWDFGAEYTTVYDCCPWRWRQRFGLCLVISTQLATVGDVFDY
ncbi:PREDICTED: uncharacterized protein LOC101307275 isoform X1 [Fragaria vesca subsp. vesca]|uniref:uncharacterized protein LOC101307275 isoform X1 n=1 Tax=Fragaria vesca subsp. vesca TaxID=101020 RepID=UPI0002C31E48|nr:PREDICTED: uncharacterized protein LOC101307275 isoform X1 [Fragaria vesca subsp. vesca]